MTKEKIKVRELTRLVCDKINMPHTTDLPRTTFRESKPGDILFRMNLSSAYKIAPQENLEITDDYSKTTFMSYYWINPLNSERNLTGRENEGKDIELYGPFTRHSANMLIHFYISLPMGYKRDISKIWRTFNNSDEKYLIELANKIEEKPIEATRFLEMFR